MFDETLFFEQAKPEERFLNLNSLLATTIAMALLAEKHEEMLDEDLLDTLAETLQKYCQDYAKLAEELNVPPYVWLFDPVERKEDWFFIDWNESAGGWNWYFANPPSPSEEARLRELNVID